MGKRNEDGTWKDSCLDKVQPNEPIFVLRAQDILSVDLVREWAAKAEIHGTPKAKVIEALECAHEMSMWPNRKYPD